jgi:hypothetical protein
VTTVRDLLDVAAAELGASSLNIVSGRAPGASAAASGWSLLLPAAQHLALQTAGPWSKVNASLVRQLAAVRAPDLEHLTVPASSVRRAAQAMGAAGDLMSTQVRTGSSTERQALLGEGLRLLVASAEVTLHGIGPDLAFGSTIASAARAGDLARASEMSTRRSIVVDGPLASTAAPSPALPRSHPGGPLAHALLHWTRLARKLDDRPAFSSQDLRGTAMVGCHLLGCVQRIQAAAPPDATAAPMVALQRWTRQWQRAEELLGRLVIVGPTHGELARASWDVVAEVQRLVAVPDLSPQAASLLSRATVDALKSVADDHCRTVRAAATTGQLLARTDRVAWSVQHPGNLARATWLPATAAQVRPLVLTYERLMTTREPRVGAVGRSRSVRGALTAPRTASEAHTRRR